MSSINLLLLQIVTTSVMISDKLSPWKDGFGKSPTLQSREGEDHGRVGVVLAWRFPVHQQWQTACIPSTNIHPMGRCDPVELFAPRLHC